jgi:hypothetical protein
MESSKKLYIAIAVLAVLGVVLYTQSKKQAADEHAHSFSARAADLPVVNVDEETRKAIDTIELTPAPTETDASNEDDTPGDAGAPVKADEPAKREVITLKKKDDEAWDLKTPVVYTANPSNVKSLIDNLDKLKVTEQVSASADDYERWGLTEEKALHAVFKKGEETVLDLYLGDNGSRGQMMRVAGKDGVYALKGYSKYLYSRDVKGWRDKGILKFDDKAAAKVTIENEHGVFSFVRAGDAWTAKHKASETAPEKDIPDFKSSKVDDLVRAYKSLNASDFGDGKKPEEVGLDKAIAMVTIELKEGTAKHVIMVGDNSEGSGRWIKTNGSEQIYSVSSWTADWATAEPSKFQQTKAAPAGTEDEGAPAGMPPGMPPGMGAPPGAMPPGHP